MDPLSLPIGHSESFRKYLLRGSLGLSGLSLILALFGYPALTLSLLVAAAFMAETWWTSKKGVHLVQEGLKIVKGEKEQRTL